MLVVRWPFGKTELNGKNMQNLVEKRRFDRFEFQKSVQVFPVLPSLSGNIFEIQNKPIEAWANDISEEGLQLEVSQTFNPNFLLKLNFDFGKNKSVEAYGKIIWSYDYHSGLRFMLVDQHLREQIQSIGEKKNN